MAKRASAVGVMTRSAAKAGRGLATPKVMKSATPKKFEWESVLSVRKSKVKGAGMGLFAAKALKGGYTLPADYRGKRLTKAQVRRLKDGSYLFFLKENSRPESCHGIDGRSQTADNPLRFVNGAMTEQQRRQINVRATQRGDKIFFVTKRRVAAGEEFLIDYGPQYWEGLKYQTRTKELRDEVKLLKAKLARIPAGSKRQRADLEEQIARCRWDREMLDEGSDADSD
mmetsp:Transcript_119054/g.333531  ORF Transcript_119054/g.333531 Transcript_119054/m.333531 type:complete len:227 (+) Transcript_119054:92-772(+)